MYDCRQDTLLEESIRHLVDLGAIENINSSKNIELVGADVDAVLISPQERLITETRAARVARRAESPVVRGIDRVDEVGTPRVAGLAYRKKKIAAQGVEVYDVCDRDEPAFGWNVEITFRVAEKSRKKIGGDERVESSRSPILRQRLKCSWVSLSGSQPRNHEARD